LRNAYRKKKNAIWKMWNVRVIFKTFFRRLKMGKKRERKGFTLIELMVVILIVGILAAVAIPLMRGRIDAAKWSEGKSMMGTIGTALRAYGAEKGDDGTWPPSMVQLGFVVGDLNGTYFRDADFTWTNATYLSTATPSLTYTISCTPGSTTLNPATVTLTHLGGWTP
jgi:prepilin-type N-terminal cleavage/methylation domain-containing protein